MLAGSGGKAGRLTYPPQCQSHLRLTEPGPPNFTFGSHVGRCVRFWSKGDIRVRSRSKRRSIQRANKFVMRSLFIPLAGSREVMNLWLRLISRRTAARW